LCGVLARWQQVKAAKMGLDNIMQLPTETQHDDSLIHRDILHGPDSEVCTRLVKWQKVAKLAEASAEAGFSGGNAAPWSSVNNCT
ncbi:hypothetical protein MJM43_31400, partial [Salmonella enterica subsp. enterica serovar Montevideo]|nr:hypothetical protein [Salmonella enterica subsp. enterica serovar Montevideo]